MNEEEKKAIETVENFIKYYKKNEQTGNRANLDVLREETQAIEFILNKYDMQQEQLNSLKEIEQQHKTDNGLLRQELDMQIEHNKELEATLKQTQDSWFEDTQKLAQEKEKNKELERYEEAYKLLSYGLNNYISKDKIKEKIEFYKEKCVSDSYNKGFHNTRVDVLEELLEEV